MRDVDFRDVAFHEADCQVQLSDDGYLRIDKQLAQQYFPEDTLVAFQRDGQLILMPTRGAAGGGLILKQRNPAGDRMVLLAELFQFLEIPSGTYAAKWDKTIGALVLWSAVAQLPLSKC